MQASLMMDLMRFSQSLQTTSNFLILRLYSEIFLNKKCFILQSFSFIYYKTVIKIFFNKNAQIFRHSFMDALL